MLRLLDRRPDRKRPSFLQATTRTLLTRAQQAGVVRGDVTAEDLRLPQRGIADTSAALQASRLGLWGATSTWPGTACAPKAPVS